MATKPNKDTIDFELLEDSQGIFDLQISEGQFVTQNSLDTALKMSLLEQRRADVSEQPVNFRRRGWWGNELSVIEGFEIGSKLWLLSQARRTLETLNFAQRFTEDALQWLIDDGFFVRIDVEV